MSDNIAFVVNFHITFIILTSLSKIATKSNKSQETRYKIAAREAFKYKFLKYFKILENVKINERLCVVYDQTSSKYL